MWEPPESLYYLQVPNRVAEEVLRPHLRSEPTKELYRKALVVQLLAVLEGQIHK